MSRPPRRRPGQRMVCLLVVLASIASLARNVGAAGFQVNEQSARGICMRSSSRATGSMRNRGSRVHPISRESIQRSVPRRRPA